MRPGEPVTLNFANADIEAVARTMATITGRNVVVDPRVKGQLNLATERAVTPAAAFEQFLAALRLQGYTVVEAGGLYKVVPEAEGKLQGSSVRVWQGGAPAAAGGGQIVTQIFKLNFENAAKLYQDIRDRWPTSFAARRQLFNIGRMNEKLGKLDEAITAYREQTTAFAESTVASEAQQALDRLKAAHPELFPEPTPAPETIEEDVTSAAPVAPAAPEVLAPAPAAPVTEPAAPADSAPVETAPGEIVPAEPAPAVDAPAAEVPAEPAPAEVAPAESAPATDAPVAPAPADAAPSEPAPAAPAQ